MLVSVQNFVGIVKKEPVSAYDNKEDKEVR